jgi:dihydroorotate dehydrogenase electron transfer subunit
LAADSFLETAVTVDTHEVAERTFMTTLRSPKIASAVTPGQFLMVSFPEISDPLLPRAFSVCDASGDTLSLLYVAVGRGTRRISRLMPGEPLVLNGPLGRGFPEMGAGRKIWAAVGGSGAALIPILSRAAVKAGSNLHFYYGARTRRQLVPFNDVTAVHHATDDGSEGFHGNVVEMLKKEMQAAVPDMLLGCGPTPMLVAMQKEFGTRVQTYLSVETPMACGMGLCQGCPVKKAGENAYHLACKDGPVFRSDEIEFETQP